MGRNKKTPEQLRRNQQVYKEREMQDIFGSLEWELYQSLERADSIAGRIMYEMGVFGIGEKDYLPFLQAKMADILEQIKQQRKGWQYDNTWGKSRPPTRDDGDE